jgi:hypothetical protein
MKASKAGHKIKKKHLIELLYEARDFLRTEWCNSWVMGWGERVRVALGEEEALLGSRRVYRVLEAGDGLYEIKYVLKPDRWAGGNATRHTVGNIRKEDIEKTLRELTREERLRRRYLVTGMPGGKRKIFDCAPKQIAEVDDDDLEKTLRKLINQRDD